MKFFTSIFCFLHFSTSTILAQFQPDHTVILILENHSYNEIFGNPDAPFINGLLKDPNTAVFTESFGLTHPSQPNYLMLFSGSTQGITDNSLPASLPFSTANLGAALLQRGFGFSGYCESLPSSGFTGEISGNYARKHNPWVNWLGSGINGIPPDLNLPFTSFPTDYKKLPTLSFVVPDQNNDMHNGTVTASVAVGDSWVKDNLNNYIQWCKTNNSLFILTFDEDDGTQNNQILTTITGENVRGGNYNQQIMHYDLLRTIEELYNLPYAGLSASSTAITGIWITTELCNNSNYTLTSNLTGTVYQWQLNTGSGFENIIDNTNYTGTNTITLQLKNIPSSFYGNQYRCSVNGNYSDSTIITFKDYWNGTVSMAWENPLNWSCGIPDGNTDVIINSGNVVVTSDNSIRSLKLKEGAKLTVGAGHTLTVAH